MKCDMCGHESDNEDDFEMPNFPENAHPCYCFACWSTGEPEKTDRLIQKLHEKESK